MLVREETSVNITPSVVKVMFEPVATDLLWQFEAPIKSWKMYKSCKVHCLSLEGMIIYMLDDVEYPFQKTTLKKMLDHNEVSSLGEDCWEQNAKGFPLLVEWFPLLEELPTVSIFPTARFPLLEDFPLQHDDKIYGYDHYTAPVTPPAYTPSIPFLAAKEPLDTLLMGDEVISTIPKRENDEFIKSSVDDLVLTPRESEMTSVCDDLECDMPATTPLPTTDVREENFDINSPLGEYVVDFLMENEDVAGLPRHLVKYLFNHLLKNLSLTKGMSDEPLGDDSKPESYDEFEDISSLDPPESTLVIDESSLLVTPLPDPKQICLREVERFDPFFSLTQSGGTTRVMETSYLGFHHMSYLRPAAYSPKEVMYRYYHPHLTTGDGFDHGPKMK
ncbi:hypothetical protein Tco_0731592 [Tanacetum coccineum]